MPCFQSTLFDTNREMLDAIAYEYWTAGGLNSSEMIDEMTETAVADDAADEAIAGFGLDFHDHESPTSHMEREGYTSAELTEAMQRFMDARPDRQR